jgi:hypothetical protein
MVGEGMGMRIWDPNLGIFSFDPSPTMALSQNPAAPKNCNLKTYGRRSIEYLDFTSKFGITFFLLIFNIPPTNPSPNTNYPLYG